MLNNQIQTPLILLEDLGCLFPNEKSKSKKRYGIYKCQCGNEFRTQTACVKSGDTQSCGCYNRARIKERITTHGLSKHPLLGVYKNIIQRTTNQKNKAYKNYGGRGITMCYEWSNDFKAFYDWAVDNGWEKGLEIDRRDNDREYSPDNCRFVVKNINARNTRRIMSTNTSGYRGVSFDKTNSKWRANIKLNGKRKHIGYFISAIEGAISYDTYIIEHNLEHTRNGVV